MNPVAPVTKYAMGGGYRLVTFADRARRRGARIPG